MHFFQQTKILPYNKSELFDLVLEVESYPQFVPGCKTARIISQEQSAEQQVIIAELTIEVKGFLEKYQSRIISRVIEGAAPDAAVYTIDAEAISGPFRYLNNSWRFSGGDGNTQLEFMIRFEFKSFLLNQLLGLFFKQAAQQMIAAFEKRAQERRGLSGR
jgi:coenzyme Q-binding protein COQ10